MRRIDEELLRGAIDVHVHQAPSLFHRHYFVDVVRDARDRGMRAVVLKSHHMMTTDRAAHARDLVPGIDVFGSITLNFAHGGINPFAVDHALRMGARVVWMPTIDTFQQQHVFGTIGGYGSKMSSELPSFYANADPIRLFSTDGVPCEGLDDVLGLIKDHDAILAVGHVTPDETHQLIKRAKSLGVTKMVVDHPYLPFTDLADVEAQRSLAADGAYLNYAFSMMTPKWFSVSVPELVKNMRILGFEHIILSSDLGQLHNPLPAEGLRVYAQLLLEEGVTEEEIDLMLRKNTMRLLYSA
jgi:hypothetical protein